MAMACVAHGDTNSEIKESITFDIPKFGIFCTCGIERMCRGYARRDRGSTAVS